MLIVLVGLDGDTSECRIAGDVVRLAQHAMTGGEATLEQAAQIDLAARSGERVEIHVVDVDVAFAMSAYELRIDDAHLVELLCGFRAVFQHGNLSGIISMLARLRAISESLALENVMSFGVCTIFT